jgi:hypothetical protein
VTLATTALVAMTTYHQTAIHIPLWEFCKVDEIARGFILEGGDSKMASGRHSLIIGTQFVDLYS